MLLLAEQERALWDKAMIARGLFHLDRSAAGKEISEFQLKAGMPAVIAPRRVVDLDQQIVKCKNTLPIRCVQIPRKPLTAGYVRGLILPG
jgi:predicted RNA polymerase sigma factor